jgi:hypothetical protein
MLKEPMKINLQLFAEGENLEDTANLNENIDVGVDSTNVEDNEGSQQPDIETTPQDQSNNKENPANHAFAEMRRKIKEQENQLRQQNEIDKTYVNLAKKLGYENVTNAKEFADAVNHQENLNKYAETNDPKYLVDAITEKLAPKITQIQQSPIVDNGLDKELEDFNKEFKGTLKSIEDILTLPNYEEVVNYMQNNNLPLSKAYALANPDKIKAASKQAAINQVRGNSHITANNNGGTVETTTVSAAELQNWKRFFPGKTEEQCRKEIVANKKLFTE